MKITIYCLSASNCPATIRYVGKTNQSLKRRLTCHIVSARAAKKQGYIHNKNYNWINKVISNGHTLLIHEIDTVTTSNWKWLEQYWISQFKTWGFHLNNLTDGGDGNNNQVMSEESNIKRSVALINRKRPEEVCKKISVGNMGKQLTESHKDNVRKAISKLQGIPVLQFTMTGEFVREWPTITEAAKHYRVDKTSLMKAAKGRFKQSAGYTWKVK